MITLHHLDQSRSQRIVWLLEELDLEYEIRSYKRNTETWRAPADLKAIHPLGKSPVITEGDVTVAESGAIIEYLIETHGPGLKPAAGSQARRDYQYWLHFAEGSLMSPMLIKLILDRINSAKMPFFAKPIARNITKRTMDGFVGPELENLFGYIEDYLGQHTWFAGEEFSGADIQMSYPLEAAAARGTLTRTRPHITAWLDRIHERPAYKRALEKTGDYGFLSS
ncbi:glutathione S-transferase [Maricaulis sp. D1M11]|uniref:glutathione S-transferase n=1 Tax=Maricaulis sp. D1M11 TaxID=3076117 RepID=UPI0039B65BF1